ncbi:MAG TPA: YslB family protein [Bacillota bacterium]|nr:YslB family protein [Bacillota bacterium]
MATNDERLSFKLLESLHTTGAGYDILRYISLPDLFGSETNTLLYYTGKNLARKFDIDSVEDVSDIFEKLGWGRLDFVKEKRRYLEFELMSDAVVRRLNAPIETEFRLEAGFLAAAIQAIKEQECECTEEINKKLHQVILTVVFTS